MIPGQFFAFYGNSYQMWNHVISAHIGRWQERRIQPEQKHFPPTQQRFVDFGNIHNIFVCINVDSFYHLDYALALTQLQKIGQTVACMCKI